MTYRRPPPAPSRRHALALAAGLAATALLPACGGGTDRRRAQVRLVNASTGYAALDLRVDDELKHGAVAPGERAAYAEADPDEPETTVFATGSPTALLRFRPALAADRWLTVLAFGPIGALRALALDDNRGEPDDGRALLRVVNAAADAGVGDGALDVYLTGDADDLAGAVPLQAGARYGVAGDWTAVTAGTWRLRVTAAGSKTDVRLDRRGVVLPSRALRTLVLRSTAGGVAVDALLLAQRGGIEALPVTEARVRLAALVTGSAGVDAALGSVVLGSGVGAPAVGEYRRVEAGRVTPTLAVDGRALAAPALDLEAGREYTLLLSGPPDAPRATLLADDNRLPADAARAQLRLVNGLAEAGSALAMTLDFLPVAGGVGTDGASAPEPVAATDGVGDGRIAVTTPGAAAALFVATEQVLRAGGVYTVFVGGSVAAPVGIVRRDR